MHSRKAAYLQQKNSAACGPTLTQAAPIKNKLFFPPDMAPLHDLFVMIYLILILEEKTIPLFLTPDKAVECAHAAQDALHSPSLQ